MEYVQRNRFRYEAIVYCTRNGASYFKKLIAENRYFGNSSIQAHYIQAKTACLLVFEAVQRTKKQATLELKTFDII